MKRTGARQAGGSVCGDRLLDVVAQAEQAGLGGDELRP